jgi:hypothetical protein
MTAVNDAVLRRALHQENLVQLMHAVRRRKRSVESQRIFVLVISEDLSALRPTQPLPRVA